MDLTVREQILASVSGAGITALTMTPFDVVKVRSQAASPKPKLVPYCNGLMDHVICCREALPKGTRCLSSSACARRVSSVSAMCRAPTSCLAAKRCISLQEFPHHTTKLAKTAELLKPWYARCPVGESNPFRAMVHLSRTEGPLTLWSGLPATIIMALPSTVLYFTTYEQIRAGLLGVKCDPLAASFFAGCSARLISVTSISPLELIRTKMQVDGSSFATVTNQLKTSFYSRGPSSLYLGYSATILRDVPFSGLYFAAYESGKVLLPTSLSTNQRNGLSSAIAAAIAGVLTLPADVIKTRQQMLLGPKLSNVQTITQTYSHIIANDGRRALFTGLSPRLMKVVPACSLMMTSYEATKRYFLEKKLG